jgi:3-deoxy-manno-octulosonate cytidylyltransferase (CMP-KDO synthetase)
VTTPFKVYIPARYASTRLPGKLLLQIGDKPLLRHVYEAAVRSGAQDVVIATDDSRVQEAAAGFGATVIMTSTGHASGTERLAEAVTISGEHEDMIIVNVQGDEYGLPPGLIDQVATMLHRDREVSMATLCEKITDSETFHNPNVVKVVFDRNYRALYFSRAAIPGQHPGTEEGEPFSYQPYRHIGIYAYRVGFLRRYARMTVCGLEKSERLEQLRVLYNGFGIHIEEACLDTGLEVNTQADLERARKANPGVKDET